MKLTSEEKKMLEGKCGKATREAMEIIVALGEIYGAKKLIPVSSVQVAGVSYANLGEAGLDYLKAIADAGGKVRVLTTLNPAGMDVENWKTLGIKEDFAEKQKRVLDAFRRMDITVTCTCTPYLIGNLPRFGESIAWSESSAVCFANSVLGAKTNREGGPSALAAALTGKTAEYGLHLNENRQAQVVVEVKTKLDGTRDWGELGYAIGKKIGNKIPFITGVKKASIEELKSFSASIATYGGTALFHIKGITPNKTRKPSGEKIVITDVGMIEARMALNDDVPDGLVDFVAVGCPHASIKEIEEIARMVSGKKVKAEFWVTTARATKNTADTMGYTKTIEEAGGKFACDTCMVVAPLKGRFKVLATDSAKACYYARGKNEFKTKFGAMKECVQAAIEGKWIIE
ncbi:aconitase X catalytic domain-containing protein [Candidatus Micrarchaeota archaeon]|nr:aconitase X catalytic domain-containing protein [Candidatus Micrarchaeota archaeon]